MRNAFSTMLTLASCFALLAGCTGDADNVTAGQNDDLATAVDANPAQADAVAADGNATAAGALPAGEAILIVLERVSEIPDEPNDQVSVSDVKFVTGIGGNFITANVRYGGGCRDHEFKAYWNGSWQKSNPPGIDITLRHNANGDSCRALFNRLVQINISEPAETEKEFWVQLTNVAGPDGRVDVKIP